MANQEKNQTIENLKEISTLWNNKELLKMSGKLRDIKSKLDGVFRDVNARNNEDDQKQVVQPTPVEKKVVKEEKEFTRPKFVKENKSNNKPFRADRPDFKNNKTQRQNRNNNFERNYEQRQDNTS